MTKGRMRCILSGLKRFELTLAETEFVAFAEVNLNQDGPLVKVIELVLEGIYSRKTKFIRRSILSMLRKEGQNFYPAGTTGKTRPLSLKTF